ncbi:hypothetical protein BC938DRAFT_478422 [Jimgerdemannia flammicorona]|uniref:PUA-like domain-containing protein n=1 Tax=Jimgerdemannia flammicorona TaxID=994334 RepID=A0A433QMX0_9FUNG|nr:hypothetical protein BC938DRAFT_478422 [Jimgerdemannia flammicorona]
MRPQGLCDNLLASGKNGSSVNPFPHPILPQTLPPPTSPPISGIAGGKMGCPSIVLAAGYPEDADDGDEFTYTGSGGRDLTGNKRTGSQTADQALDRFNLALAKTCHAGLNEKFGADAGDLWYKSGPIRVVRSDKLKRHHPMFAPAEGQRYDGIYKLVKDKLLIITFVNYPFTKKRFRYPCIHFTETKPPPAFPPTDSPQQSYKSSRRTCAPSRKYRDILFIIFSHSGHLVWRFLMRRDDPDPAPWTVEGKRRIAELGLRMVFPNDDDKGKGKGKVKAKCYEIPADVVTMMRQDAKDERVWEDVMEQKFWSEYEFLHYVFSTAVVCCVCSETITDPVTTSCGHIACLTCLRKVTSKEPRCPWCRSDLKDPETGKVSYAVNGNLVAVLKRINWAYAGGRLPEKYSSATVGSTVKEMKGVQASKGKNRGEDKAPTNVSSKARGKLERKRKEVLVEEEEEEELRDADVGLEDEEEVDELDNDDDFIETWNKKGKARTKAARRATRKRKAILEMEEEEEVVMDLLDDDDDFVVAPRKKGKGKGKAKAAPRATRKRKVILEMEDDDDGFVVTPRKKGQAALRTGRKRRAILEEEEEEQEEVNELADDLVETPLEGVETVQKDMAARSWRSKRKWEIYVEI